MNTISPKTECLNICKLDNYKQSINISKANNISKVSAPISSSLERKSPTGGPVPGRGAGQRRLG